jgi:hypothetical protein
VLIKVALLNVTTTIAYDHHCFRFCSAFCSSLMLFCPQASDYAVILKLHDWDKLHAATYNMLLLLACFKQGEYCRSLVAHLNILCCHESDDTDIWKWYLNDPSSMNEEPGEDSFGILARCVLGDTQKTKFSHVSDMYSLLHLYRQVNADTKDDIAGPLQQKKFTTGTFMVKEDSKEVEELGAFFRTVIREVMSGSFRVYDGSVKARTSKAKAQECMKRVDAPKQMLDHVASKAYVMTQLAKVKRTMKGQYWLSAYSDIWPEANVVPVANANDERLGRIPREHMEETTESCGDEVQEEEPMSDADGEPILVVQDGPVDRNRKKVAKAARKQKKPKGKKRRKVVSALSADDVSDDGDDEPLSSVRAAMRKEGNEGEGEEDADDDEADWKEGDMGVPDHIIGERVYKGVAQILILWEDGRVDLASWEDKNYYLQWDDYATLFDDWATAKPAWDAEQAKKNAHKKSSSKAYKGGRY